MHGTRITCLTIKTVRLVRFNFSDTICWITAVQFSRMYSLLYAFWQKCSVCTWHQVKLWYDGCCRAVRGQIGTHVWLLLEIPPKNIHIYKLKEGSSRLDREQELRSQLSSQGLLNPVISCPNMEGVKDYSVGVQCTVLSRTFAAHFLHKRCWITWNVKRRLVRSRLHTYVCTTYAHTTIKETEEVVYS